LPTYSYRDNDTGREWNDFRPMSSRDDGVDGVKIVRLLSAPNIFPSESGHEQVAKTEKFREKILNPIMKAHTGREMQSKM
jgi:hypothetical protein